jgi:O-antigen biosynthesis protein
MRWRVIGSDENRRGAKVANRAEAVARDRHALLGLTSTAELDEGTCVPKDEGRGGPKMSASPPAKVAAAVSGLQRANLDAVFELEGKLRARAATYDQLFNAWKTLSETAQSSNLELGQNPPADLKSATAGLEQVAPRAGPTVNTLLDSGQDRRTPTPRSRQTDLQTGDDLSRRLAAIRAYEERLLHLEGLIKELSGRLQSAEDNTRRLQDSRPPSIRENVLEQARFILALAAAGAAVAAVPALGAAGALSEIAAKLLPGRLQPSLPIQHPATATIIILNFQGEELLRRNLPSVLTAVARTGRPHEILVVDNGSTDRSVALLREEFPEVRVLALDRNYFFSAGNNAGVRFAANDLIVLLNNDMRVEPDFLEPLLQPFEGRNDIFAVSSQIFFADRSRRQEESGLTAGRFVHGSLQLTHLPVPSGSQELLPILWAGGGSCAIDRRKYLELGGLDILFDPFYCEDTDLSLRAWQHGWKVLFAPASRVHHEHRATSKRLFGEAFVNETFRRNVFLFHWVNLRDPKMLAAHLWNLPEIVHQQVRQHGWSGVRSFAKALTRAPRAFARRLRVRSPGPSDAEILDFTASVDPNAPARPPKLLQSSRNLRMVVVTPYQFHPPTHGGAVFTHNLVRGLARRGHEISVVGFVDTEAELAASQGLKEFCAEVHLQIRAATPGNSDPLGLTPRMVEEFDQPVLHRVLDQVVARLDPDVVHTEYTQMAPYGKPSLRRVNSITEVDLSFVSAYRRALNDPTLRGKINSYSEYLRLFHYELTILARFDLIFMVNQREGELLSAYSGGNLQVARAPFGGLDISRFDGLVRTPSTNTILFVGYFRHPPNVDAVLHFARDILPRIHREFPSAEFVIVGAGAPSEILQLAADPRIRVMGFVEDLLPLYASAAALVSPIRFGAGVRVKLLEAFAARIPVVATNLAAEGLSVSDGNELLLADGSDEFAAKTLRLLREPRTGAEVAARARAFVERFDSPRVIEGIENEYREALRRKHLLLEERAR